MSVLPGPAGAAATRKLLRSVFYKGMAAAAIEALHAARAAGCEDWLREHIAAELAAADAGTLARLEQGSYQHARRREHEMAAATDLLNELSVPPRVARASQRWLEDLAGQPDGGYRMSTVSTPGSTVSVVSKTGGPPGYGAVTVTVTACPARSVPADGETESVPAGAGSEMLNVTGPPCAVTVKDPW